MVAESWNTMMRREDGEMQSKEPERQPVPMQRGHGRLLRPASLAGPRTEGMKCCEYVVRFHRRCKQHGAIMLQDGRWMCKDHFRIMQERGLT